MIKETFALAFQKHKNKNYSTAESLYKKVLKIDPNHFESIYLLGSLSVQTYNFDRAKNYYEKAIKIKPDDTNTLYNLGVVFAELGEAKKAISYYEKTIAIRPNHANTHNNLGVVYLKLGEYKKAISCFKQAIQIDPNYAAAHNNLGIVFKELGEHQKAISCYEKAIEIQPNHANAHNNLGNIFRKLKEFQKAANYFVRSATVFGNAQFLECTYFSNGVENYNKLLNTFAEKNPTNLRIAALASYVSTKENIKNVYPFCKKPLNYFFSINLRDEFESSDQFYQRLLKISEKLESSWQIKNIVKNGYQSTGNLLDKPFLEITVLKKMWLRGDSAKMISLQLCTTRNAVIGKANRLGLPLHPSRSENDYSDNNYYYGETTYEPKLCSTDNCKMTAQPGRDYCAYHCRQIIEEQKKIKEAS